MRKSLLLVVLLAATIGLCQGYTESPQDFEEELLKIEESLISKLDERISSAQPEVDLCSVCEQVLSAISGAVSSNVSVDIIETIATAICIEKKVYGGFPDVCGGAVREFAPEIIYILTHKTLDPHDFCARLKLCPTSSSSISTPFVQVPELSAASILNLPGQVTTTPLPSASHSYMAIDPSSDIGTFAFFSDVHIDPKYSVGSNAGCGKPLCCRAADGPPSSPADAAGLFGDFRCDTSPAMLDSMVKFVSSISPAPDFALVGGDDPPHDVWEQSREENVGAIQLVAQKLKEAFGSIPVYSAIGNHESFPVNQFEGPGFDDWLNNAVADAWSSWLPQDSQKTLRFGGYYTVSVPNTKLRVVSLQTNYCNNDNFWLLLNDTDGGQLAWFADVMSQARSAGQRVYLLAHLSPSDCLEPYAESLHTIIEQNADIIAGQFYGHTHVNKIIMFRDSATNSKPISNGWLGPSVTTYTGYHPAFRIFTYNRTTFEPLDYTVYLANITEANANNKADWKVSYTARAEYSLNGLSAGDYQDFISRMWNDDNLFQKFWYHVNHDTDVSCDTKCKKNMLCDCSSATENLYKQCMGTPNVDRAVKHC